MAYHLHILMISGELATGVDHYTLIVTAQISETGTELGFIEPYFMKSVARQTQSTSVSCVCATSEASGRLG